MSLAPSCIRSRLSRSDRKLESSILSNNTGTTEVGQRYATAYAAHYATKDFSEALALYKAVVVAHPDSQEAGYSRSQIQRGGSRPKWS